MQKMRARNITDRTPYQKAHKNYDELHDLLGNLTGKLAEVSKDVDQEFLASYRVHMLSIQTEIKTLREDVDKGVQALKSDGNVAKLELEVNWFVEECTRLRLHYTTMENDCFQMQTRFKSMMEQKVYMNEQLKAIMKRNRVLEAEIEHALKYNQKVKLSEDQNEMLQWAEQKAQEDEEDQIGFEPDFDQQEPDANADLPPDNYYHEQLRRLSEKVPLSTSVFVPPVKSRSSKNNSQQGSRPGSRPTSRTSSRGSSRSPSPSRPDWPGSSPMCSPGARPSMSKKMVSIRSHHSAELDSDDDDIGFEDAAQRQFRKDFSAANDLNMAMNMNMNMNMNKSASSSLLRSNQLQGAAGSAGGSLRHSESLKSLGSAAGAGGGVNHFLSSSRPAENNHHANVPNEDSKRIPRQQQQPSGTWRAKQKALQQKNHQHREELITFLKHKSPAEASLERAIADIFTEVRARKVVAAKRGAIKRYPVSFMGNDDPDSTVTSSQQQPQQHQVGSTMSRRRSGASMVSQSQSQSQFQSQSVGSPPVMAGTALGRRLGASATAAAAGADGAEETDRHRRTQGEEGGGGGPLGDEEVDLLRQPLIQATGGISGLGAKQLSDNDKFSVIVKYLLDFDRFAELVEKLQENQQR